MSVITPVESGKLTSPLVWIEVSTANLRHNIQAIQKLLSPGVSVLSVVKANAYGHGLVSAAKALSADTAWFGVNSLDEGLRLRQEGLRQPILLFGHTGRDEIRAAVQADLTLSISDLETARAIDQAARALQQRARVHVKIDTGMGRFGFSLREAEDAFQEMSSLAGLSLEGLYTHMPQSEAAGSAENARQLNAFAAWRARLAEKGFSFAWTHALNSCGIAHYPQAHFNLVRPGLSLYGVYPHPSLQSCLALKPALSLKSRWVLIKKMAAGESVGYGRTYALKQDGYVGILPLGYSHGYPFRLSGKGEVLCRGKRYAAAGRVSMDYIAVALGEKLECGMGDEVVLIGDSGQESIRAEDLAEKAGTIPYEILTSLKAFIPRVYGEA